MAWKRKSREAAAPVKVNNVVTTPKQRRNSVTGILKGEMKAGTLNSLPRKLDALSCKLHN